MSKPPPAFPIAARGRSAFSSAFTSAALLLAALCAGQGSAFAATAADAGPAADLVLEQGIEAEVLQLAGKQDPARSPSTDADAAVNTAANPNPNPNPSANPNAAVGAVVQAGPRKPGAPRFEVVVGQLDRRLHLAPCDKVEPYVPKGMRLWGRSRIGLRCAVGTTHWNVYLPITVKVFGPGLVATSGLTAGSTVTAADVTLGEVDLALETSGAVLRPALAIGRTLTRALGAGQSVRESDLKSRQWFAAGETVTLVADGDGFTVSGDAQALNAGIEGQPVRVRTPGGRVLTGQPVGERRVELTL